MTAAGYQDVMSRIPFADIPAETRRAHIAAETSEGMFVAAVWESEEAFRSFEPALQAAFAAAGVTAAAPVVGAIHQLGISPAAVHA